MSVHDLTAPLAYGVDDKTRHWQYFEAVPRTEAEKARHPLHKTDMGGATTVKQTTILDARHHLPNAQLDEAGFELSTGWKPSLSHEEFYQLHEEPALVSKLYSEVSEYLKRHLGAAEVAVFHHQVRNEGKTGVDYHGPVAGYAHSEPHTDSSALGGDELYLSLVESFPTLKKHAGKGRYLYLNLWRNISDTPILTNHLAMLDERTVVRPDDYITKDLFMHNGSVHVPQFRINARHHHLHKWYYYPAMKSDEALLFKQADSDHTKPSRICFHVAVTDHNAPEGAPSRESIEVRCLAIFPDAPTTVPTKELISADKINRQGGLPVGVERSRGSSFGCLGALVARVCAPKQEDEIVAKVPMYVNKVMMAVVSFDMWPSAGKAYVLSMVKGLEEKDAVAAIATMLSQDATGYLGLRQKSSAFKTKVVEAACDSEKFVNTVRDNVLTKSEV